jgi:diguanylate cyclase (GGDEF)-like protein
VTLIRRTWLAGRVHVKETRKSGRDSSEKMQRRSTGFDGEDIHLWSISALVGLVLTASFAALIIPNLAWHVSVLRADARYLPHLLLAFVALILVFNIYVFEQRRKLKWTREELIRQLTRGEVAERLALVDPLTETFNRRYMEQILSKEASRADRTGASLSLLMIDVDDFKAVNTRFGHQEGDHILTEIARLLKNTFRGSDTLVRYGGDEFVVIMPDTSEEQGKCAIARLLRAVEGWNLAGLRPGYHMSVSCGIASYCKGADIAEVLETADQRMYMEKGPSRTRSQSKDTADNSPHIDRGVQCLRTNA